ncbi:MAG: carboxymuconolactone decarboxylase family protein [Gammaproteobacteria bacterium]
MSEFTSLTIDTAPTESKPLLHQVRRQLGFVPNLLAAMAASPATLQSYLSLTDLFDQTHFSVTERQFILLTISRHRNCCYCLAAHGSLAKMQKIPADIVNAVYYKQPLNDVRLEALRSFTLSVLEQQGWVGRDALDAFYQAGFGQQHVLEVVLAISFKTLSNFINHINDTPIDDRFLIGLPEKTHDSCCESSA